MHNFPPLVFGTYILFNEGIDACLQLNIKLLLQRLHVLVGYGGGSTGTTSRRAISIIDSDIHSGVRRIVMLNHGQALLGNHGDAASGNIAGWASLYCLYRR